MIYTNEPANTYYVYLTAYHSYKLIPDNEVSTKDLTSHIQGHQALYGTILSEGVVGVRTEEGNTGDTVERVLQVHCTSWHQVLMLAELAHVRYDQESILVVASQTRAASLVSVRTLREYPQGCETLGIVPMGVFTQQDTGAKDYYILDGERWEVA